MSKYELYELNIRLRSLAVFRALLDDPVIAALGRYLEAVDSAPMAEAVSKYAAFVSALYGTGKRTLAGYIQSIVNNDENAYIRMIGRGTQPWPEMETDVWAELEVLQKVADLTPETLREGLDWNQYLPKFAVKKLDIAESYRERCSNIGKYGYGIYAKYHMFYLNPEGKIVPVKNPDTTRLSSLVDYKREQQIILDNTQALLDGKPAANILLTGDAGTGKSSTIKAVVNELYEKGLRILEVRKEQLHQIPEILDELNANPLKFILFIDDLSFQKDDDNFSALKAILEGSVSAKSQNVVIYATSNRRHLVKETFSDRDGDDIHRNDTMQEIISLSERFGIQITFQKPDKKTYLDIVHHLAEEKGLHYSTEELDLLAERFILSRGGRSARAAKQFIDSLVAAKG
ncbi:MAG: ATP-binding protein [Oscillospiraceae bacterium]|nr:ATP-binding protein [Oscillospiraceae bacterium]